jgi:hypothetical protein
MADGPPQRIANVQVGDRVKSRDPQTGVEGVKTVTATIQRLAPALVHLSLTEAKTGQSETLTCTPEHPLFVSGRGWVAAGSLGIGSLIVSRAGPLLSVSSVMWEREAAGGAEGGGTEDKPYTVYNLTVEDDHTYFVGTVGGGTWVHNGCLHHIATNKNTVARGQWTNRFRSLFEKNGVDIDKGPENIADLSPHSGPHPEEYHEWVWNHLKQAQDREDFLNRLQAIKNTLLNDPTIINNGPYPGL